VDGADAVVGDVEGQGAQKSAVAVVEERAGAGGGVRGVHRDADGHQGRDDRREQPGHPVRAGDETGPGTGAGVGARGDGGGELTADDFRLAHGRRDRGHVAAEHLAQHQHRSFQGGQPLQKQYGRGGDVVGCLRPGVGWFRRGCELRVGARGPAWPGGARCLPGGAGGLAGPYCLGLFVVAHASPSSDSALVYVTSRSGGR